MWLFYIDYLCIELPENMLYHDMLLRYSITYIRIKDFGHKAQQLNKEMFPFELEGH